MKKLFFIVLICANIKGTAQNLVPNPSFELYTTCPIDQYQQTGNSVLNWQNPLYQSVNFHFFNSCANISTNASVPLNWFGYETAFNGNAYLGIILSGDFSNSIEKNLRIYATVKTNNTLVANKYYSVSLGYSCNDSLFYATKNFGVLFTNILPQFSSPSPLPSEILQYTPQLENFEFLDNRVGWKKLSWIYKAKGNENYLTLGNFKNNNAADAIVINPQASDQYKGAGIYIDDVVVEPYNCDTELPKDTTVCNKEIINIQLPSNTLANYTWQDGTVGANYTIANAGIYWVTTAALGCVTTDTIKVKYKKATPFSLGGNRVLCNAETLTLQVPNIYNSYLWQNGSTNNSIQVKDSGIYYVTATQGKCTFADTIKVVKTNCQCEPLLPTAFTPNADNVNDMFGPKINCAVKNYAFTLYNRYGQMVFSSTNISEKWNGKFNNKQSPNGSYVYVLQYSLQSDAILQKQGSVLLVR